MKITQEKLNQILEAHGKWYWSDGVEGERADLRRADLQGADLRRAYLQGADLQGADLRRADLQEAYLQEACLDKTYYQIVRIGSRNATTTYCVEDDNVLCGCWNCYKGGTLEEFKERVESVYGEDGEVPNNKYYAQYTAAIEFFEKMAALAKEDEINDN